MGIMNPLHLAFIAVIALLFLGPKRLPDLAKTLGSGMREFREAISGEATHDAPAPLSHIEALASAEQPTDPGAAVAPDAYGAPQAASAHASLPPSPAEQELAAPTTAAAAPGAAAPAPASGPGGSAA